MKIKTILGIAAGVLLAFAAVSAQAVNTNPMMGGNVRVIHTGIKVTQGTQIKGEIINADGKYNLSATFDPTTVSGDFPSVTPGASADYSVTAPAAGNYSGFVHYRFDASMTTGCDIEFYTDPTAGELSIYLMPIGGYSACNASGTMISMNTTMITK